MNNPKNPKIPSLPPKKDQVRDKIQDIFSPKQQVSTSKRLRDPRSWENIPNKDAEPDGSSEAEARRGHPDNESKIKVMGEVRQVKAEEGPNIKETETNLENPDEKNDHCTSGTHTRNTSLLLEDWNINSQTIFF